MTKKGNGLSWNVWKKSAKDAVAAIYENALRRVGVADPEVHTIHAQGEATISVSPRTMSKVEGIEGIYILSNITGEGRVKIFIPEVAAWLEQNTPFYTDEERAALRGKGGGASEEEKAAREKRKAAKEAVKALFEKRFGYKGENGTDIDQDAE